MRMRIAGVLLCAAALTSTALAADPSAPPAASAASAPSAAPAASGPKRAVYDKLFAEWRSLIAELIALEQKHVAAQGDEKEAIKKRYRELVAKGEILQPKVAKAAEEAYLEAPGADAEIELFLLSSCNGYFKMDNYEEAFRLAKLLIDRGALDRGTKGEKRERVYFWGGVAAFCVGDLDTAEQYMTAAAKQGVSLQSGKGDSLDAVVARFLQDPRPVKAAWKKEQEIRAAETKANDLPRVLLKTTAGDIVVELFENEAPNTVANFISLVEKKFYNGLTFHRVLEGFMAQGGCPHGDGSGDAGYNVPCECYRADHRNHYRGVLSMALSGAPDGGVQRDSGGSQFFLTFIPASFLDGNYTVFGRVVEGMDVLSKIRRRNPDDPKDTLAKADKIIEAKVIRKRPHEYVPKKAGQAEK